MKWFPPILYSLLFIINPALAQTDTILCKYDSYSDEVGSHKVTKRFELTFIVDSKKDLAYIVGDQGSDEVTPVFSETGGMTFIEITPVGNVMTTTIDYKGSSVHSRNTVIDGKIIPTQYYGNCKFK